MAQVVFGVVGAAVGGYFGGPQGASLGWAIGTTIGSAFAPPNKVYRPRLTDLKLPTFDYGSPVPRVFGAHRVPGAVVWMSAKREIATTQDVGKGGPRTEVTSYTYHADVLYMLSDRQIDAVRRVWSGGELVWSAHAGSSDADLAAGQTTGRWADMRVYTGDAAQQPDAVYEAAVGAGNAPAYRGRATVLIESLDLGPSGQLPVLTFEVIENATVSAPTFVETEQHPAHMWHIESGYRDLSGADGNFAYVDKYTAYCATATALGTVGTDIAVSSGKRYFEIEILDSSSSAVEALWFWVKDSSNNTYGSNYHAYWCTSDGSNVALINFRSDGSVIQPNGGALYDGVVKIALDSTSGQMWLGWGGHWFATSGDGNDANGNPHPETPNTGRASGLTGQGMTIHYTINAQTPTNWATIRTRQEQSENTPPAGYIWWSSDGINVYDVTPNPVYLDDIVEEICVSTGQLSAADVDVTALAGIEVDGFALTQVGTARAALEMLATAYYFDCFETDKIYFKLRGSSSVATIPWIDLGAGRDQAADEPLQLERGNDLEVPAGVVLTYANPADDYQTGTVYSDRMATYSSEVMNVPLPLVLDSAQAQGIVETIAEDGRVAANAVNTSLTEQYPQIVPTDVVTLTESDGSTYRVRVVRDTWAAGVRAIESVVDQAGVLVSTGTTDETAAPVLTVTKPDVSDLVILDIPLLRNQDKEPGVYVTAAPPNGGAWGGCDVQYSTDSGASWTTCATLRTAATMGYSTAALADWTGGERFDELNSVTVKMTNGTLSSTTRDELLDNGANMALLGRELIQFRTATLVSPGVYTLSGLLRGRRGTEWACVDHGTTERFVLLSAASLARVPLERVPHYGKANYWRAVTFGRTDGDTQLFTWDDESSKPFSPTNLRFPTDATATWTYRGRLIDSGFADYVELPELEAESSYYIARRLTTVFVADTTRFVTTTTASISYFATYWLEVVAYRNSGPTSRAARLLMT